MTLMPYKNQHVPTALSPFIKANTIVCSAPGRINLIGEHTDYNEGFVLPAAINKRAIVALTPREDNKIILTALNKNETLETSITDIKIKKGHWANYLLGVVAMFQKRDITLKGFDVSMISDVPMGAGLSSSAAIECAMAGALNTYVKSNFSQWDLVKIAQKAEHEYAGVLCGIMDQFASVFGKKNNVMRLDCKTLEFVYKPFTLSGYKIILLDTSIKHNLASSEYNTRRLQCEKGVAWVSVHFPEVKSLRNLTIAMLDQHVLHQDKIIYERCKYVVEENARVLAACDDLDNNNIADFGKKMFATHEGLSQLYAVSCKELDFLVNEAKSHSDILGSRMMGGGFGGCTINLIKANACETVVEKIKTAYQNATQLNLKVYEVSIENGLEIL